MWENLFENVGLLHDFLMKQWEKRSVKREEAPKWIGVFDADIDELGQSIQRVKDSWEMNSETKKDIVNLLTEIKKLYRFSLSFSSCRYLSFVGFEAEELKKA